MHCNSVPDVHVLKYIHTPMVEQLMLDPTEAMDYPFLLALANKFIAYRAT